MYLSEEDYITTQHQLITLASIVRELPLAAFINQANLAETMGPILDPTLFNEAGQNLNDVKSLAEELLPFQTEILRQLRKWTKHTESNCQCARASCTLKRQTIIDDTSISEAMRDLEGDDV